MMSPMLIGCMAALTIALGATTGYRWWAPPHEYLKDHTIVEKDGVYHLFSICGVAGQDWLRPWGNGNEGRFLHAVSRDLVDWQVEGYVLPTGPNGAPDADKVWAPHVVKSGGTYFMFYTGVTHAQEEGWSDHVETICLATSVDLKTWTKHPLNPVFRAPKWADHPNPPIACRDPMVFHDTKRKRWVMYYTALTRRGDRLLNAVGVAVSADLLHWGDAGCAVTDERNGATESSFVTMRDGRYFMFLNDRISVSDDPVTGWSEPKPYAGPPGGFAGEILHLNGKDLRTVIGEDPKHFHIAATEIVWSGDNCSFKPYSP